MPHIRVRSVDLETLKKKSGRIVDRLQEAVGCERSWFTLEKIETTYVSDGKTETRPPFVEIVWFARDLETKKKVAKILSEELRGDAEYVTVVFRDLEETDYYENGELV